MAPSSSHLSQRTQVMVVGAGPVGLLAALRLRERGASVRVIEQQSEHDARTFPVVLHPQSLRILGELGLSPALFWRGRALTRLAIYTDHQRRALLELPNVRGAGAGALTLPQDILRKALKTALGALGVAVEWNTRLTTLSQDERSVWGRLEHDGTRSSGGSHATMTFEADYVIGADGYESTVREAIGAQMVPCGPLASFAFFDASTTRAGREAQLVLAEESSSSVYPLRDGVSRFSFQLARSLHQPLDQDLLRELVAARLPWYSGGIGRCSWCGVAEFRQALTDHFGKGRVWLAGEAAHFTSPLGVQSLNIGLDEADELARRVVDALQYPSTRPFGPDYEAKRRFQWREMLGLQERTAPGERAPEWARRNLKRLLSCLPASGADLDDLLDQLRLTDVPRRPGLGGSLLGSQLATGNHD